MQKVEDEIFIDRDGKTFEMIINYLRNNREIFPDFKDESMKRNFFMELFFWDIDKKNARIQK